MREKLNSNPIAQVALIGILVVVGGILFLSKSGGGEEGGEESGSAEVVATVNGSTATGSTPGEAVEGAVEGLEAGASTGEAAAMPTAIPAPPPPAAVTDAYRADRTVVLLIVHKGGIDDALTAVASAQVASMPDTALFVVPSSRIARYAAVTVGLDLNRVPALVVMRPRRLSNGVPQATVDYGFQTPQSVAQAVRDASYKGPEATYHPN